MQLHDDSMIRPDPSANGYAADRAVLWSGPSLLDGAPIVVLAGYMTDNPKTGAVVQTFILRADQLPGKARRQGLDTSICGDCTHRGKASGGEGTCYVNIGQGPTGVYKAWQRGRYAYAENLQAVAVVGRGRVVRLGTYGDPAAVPSSVWIALLSDSTGHTGYTHQWRTSTDRRLRDLVMASADNATEAQQARDMGWRFFLVQLPGDHKTLPQTTLCPASKEGGRKLVCAQCKACDGAGTGKRGSIYIPMHGGTAVMANANRAAAARGLIAIG